MIRSMTGFAGTIIPITLNDKSKTSISINIKSLNSRYFETTCKIPHHLAILERDIVKNIKKKLHRGHIYFTIYMSNQNVFATQIDPSLAMIDGYVQAIDAIQKKYPIKGDLHLADILQLPNIFTIQEKEIDNKTKTLILKTISDLLDQLVAMQEKEGSALQKDLENRISHMHAEIKIIEELSAQLMIKQKEKITQTLAELPTEENSLHDMKKSTAYALLDKMDINEEIVRFNSHITSITQQITSDAIERGKRLDFTLQEIAREINTIAAKCSDATISAHAITIKVELEKAREQVQNIV